MVYMVSVLDRKHLLHHIMEVNEKYKKTKQVHYGSKARKLEGSIGS